MRLPRFVAGSISKLSVNWRAWLRDNGLIRAALIVLRTLMRRHASSGQQGDGYPYVDDNPYPPGKSLEKYPRRLKSPADHLDPEPYLLSGLFPRELRKFACAWW